MTHVHSTHTHTHTNTCIIPAIVSSSTLGIRSVADAVVSGEGVSFSLSIPSSCTCSWPGRRDINISVGRDASGGIGE